MKRIRRIMGSKEEEPVATPGGNGHSDIDQLTATVQAQGQTILRVIDHLQRLGQPQVQSIATQRERRDLFETLTDPPDEALPALTDVTPMMATMIPAMNVIKWGFTPLSERPINPKTQRPYGMYNLWEMDFARWSLSKNAHNAIRLCDVVQTRGEATRMGVVAE